MILLALPVPLAVRMLLVLLGNHRAYRSREPRAPRVPKPSAHRAGSRMHLATPGRGVAASRACGSGKPCNSNRKTAEFDSPWLVALQFVLLSLVPISFPLESVTTPWPTGSITSTTNTTSTASTTSATSTNDFIGGDDRSILSVP